MASATGANRSTFRPVIHIVQDLNRRIIRTETLEAPQEVSVTEYDYEARPPAGELPVGEAFASHFNRRLPEGALLGSTLLNDGQALALPQPQKAPQPQDFNSHSQNGFVVIWSTESVIFDLTKPHDEEAPVRQEPSVTLIENLFDKNYNITDDFKREFYLRNGEVFKSETVIVRILYDADTHEFGPATIYTVEQQCGQWSKGNAYVPHGRTTSSEVGEVFVLDTYKNELEQRNSAQKMQEQGCVKYIRRTLSEAPARGQSYFSCSVQ